MNATGTAAAANGQNNTNVSLTQFLVKNFYEKIKDIVISTDSAKHYGLDVDVLLLLNYSRLLYEKLFDNPTAEKTVSMVKVATMKCQRIVSERENVGTVKDTLTLRFIRAPYYLKSMGLSQIPKCTKIHKFVTLKGTVTRAGQIRQHLKECAFSCQKCSNVDTADYSMEVSGFVPPTQCSKCHASKLAKISVTKGPSNNVSSGEDYVDFQEIRIQEHITSKSSDTVGKVPKSITIVLQNELVDKVKPGDYVRASGAVLRKYANGGNYNMKQKVESELIMNCNNIEHLNGSSLSAVSAADLEDGMVKVFVDYWETYKNNPLEGRNNILKSVVPGLHGMYLVKLSLLLVLIGSTGKSVDPSSGSSMRGESHLLLAGDPGIGKSQFLKFACKLNPHRSVLTTGIGSTSAGLTCSAVKDGGEWQLEAGALVLADGGVCCIDEFGSIREHDKTAIHEAMEQQTLSVAKAGLVCKLNTRCSVIAATNPKGKYDSSQNIEVNLGLGSPLLSRFDLIFVLLDSQNFKWDREISSFILNSEIQVQQKKAKQEQESEIWQMEKLRAYVSYCKTFHPVLTREAKLVLSEYYQYQRQHDQSNSARTTIRLLESMIRLSQAHARMLCKQKVELDDAIVVVELMEASVHGTNLLGNYLSETKSFFNRGFEILKFDFPENPDELLQKVRDLVLGKLGLNDIEEETSSE